MMAKEAKMSSIEKYVRDGAKGDNFGSMSIGNIDVVVSSPLPEEIDLKRVLHNFYNMLPKRFFHGLDAVYVMESPIFKEREINAFYRDAALFISPDQDNEQDLVDDLVHEIAHHLEAINPEEIYSDNKLKREFVKKRKQIKFELASEGYDLNELDFEEISYNKTFDLFLYKNVGYPKMRNIGSGVFLRPYAATSIREYFASGFEAFYLGKKDDLYKVSPVLYTLIERLDERSR
jgi:hypothetical protein